MQCTSCVALSNTYIDSLTLVRTSIIQNLDDNVPQSARTDIIAALEEVSNTLNDNNPKNDGSAVCDELGAFINDEIAAQTGSALTADQANGLRTQAEDIRNMLGW
jgi:hypothetical protein